MRAETLQIMPGVSVPLDEIEFTAVRASGPGGQHVNKTSSAVLLTFDIWQSSLPDWSKHRLSQFSSQHISRAGVIRIKSQTHRSQKHNRDAAITRLIELFKTALHRPKARKATQPSQAVHCRRIEAKRRRSQVKAWRGRVGFDD